MRISKIVFIAVLLLSIVSSCKKIDNPPPSNTDLTMNDLVIPNDFGWETHKDVKLQIGVETSQVISGISKISVFKGNPQSDGVLMVSGSASADKPFITQVRIPSRFENVYLVCEFPFGSSKTQTLPIANSIAYTFSDTKSADFKSGFKSVSEEGPECDDCDLIISGSGSYNIGNGQRVCVTDDFTGSVTFQNWNGGGILQICGNANIASLQLTDNAALIVTQDGSLTVGSFSAWGFNSIIVYQNATMTVNNQFQTQGDDVEIQGNLIVNGDMTIQNLSSNQFTNSGNIAINGNFQLNNGPTLFNYGIIEANGTSFLLNNNSTCINSGTLEINSASSNHFQINSGSDFTNDGTIDVVGDISINSGSSITNNCAMICSGTFAVNTGDFVTSSGFLKGAQNVNLNFANNIELKDGSMISTVNLTMNSGGVVGSGSLNTILATGTFTIHNTNTVSGTVESATDDLVISSGNIEDHFINGATVVELDEITNFIEPGSCNPDGVGMNPFATDTDADGVPDLFDAYPGDPYRAFNNYFPDETGSNTVMFEDLWPSTGDYDFNDLVLGFYGNQITNANNEVVEMDIYFNVRAVGASFQNGIGWQFDNLAPSAIEQVTGTVLNEGGGSTIQLAANGTELGQEKAVVIAIENIETVLNRAGSSMFNTLDNGIAGTSDLVSINVLFGETTPVDQALLTQESFNVFLIINQNRNEEIHLIDYVPTAKMNTTLFGTAQDVSDPLTGAYYLTKTRLPWSIFIADEIDYPIEKIEIIDAFPDFVEWAQSGGIAKPDWYMNPDPGKIWTP